jgi:hypothetical protein
MRCKRAFLLIFANLPKTKFIMRKVIFTMTFVAAGLLFTGNLSAQHSEAHKLDKQIEATMDSAQHSITMFILKQDTTYYADAIAKVTRAKAMTKEYKALVAKEKGLGGRTDGEEAAYLTEEINMYFKPTLKQTVLNDKKKTEKYKYKGESYMVGTKSKALLDSFATE